MSSQTINVSDLITSKHASAVDSAAYMARATGVAYVYQFAQAGTLWYAPTCFPNMTMHDALSRVSLARKRAMVDLQPLNSAPKLLYTITHK